jgi:uncharacterized membrane protein
MAKKAKARLPYLLRIVRARPRMSISVLAGLIFAILAPVELKHATRILCGWNFGVWLYLILVYFMMAKSEPRTIGERAAALDEGAIAILVLTIAASIATLAAITYELSVSQGSTRNIGQLLTAILTIFTSWFFIHTIFALHYAHEYYGERGGKKGGLNFPNESDPDYWDFVYFAFVIGMTFQVSDVAITSKVIRRTVTVHSIVSFLFDVTLLALTINIAANII